MAYQGKHARQPIEGTSVTQAGEVRPKQTRADATREAPTSVGKHGAHGKVASDSARPLPAGEPAQSAAPRGVLWAFAALAVIAMLVPLVGMAWAPTEQTTENRVLAEPPSLTTEDGAPNLDVLSDAGTYFEDHFAYRNALVDADGRLHAALLTSSTDQLVVGNDGWLFYEGTMDDYRGDSHLSDQALRNIAHSMRLLQDYCAAKDAEFLFAVAPNKNSLYDAAMPYYELESDEVHNARRLEEFLDEYEVNYVDLFRLPELSDDVLYCLRDSHWTNRGAYLAANEMLPPVGKRVITVGDDDNMWMARDDFTGDLASMLYPQNPGTETNYYLAGYNDAPGGTGSLWRFVEGDDVTDDWVGTQRVSMPADGEEDGGGRLLMYRDSFANALIPYFAASFDSAVFSKLIPYDTTRITAVGADAVIVERAERHIGYLAENPPVCQSPSRSSVQAPDAQDDNASETTAAVSKNGPFTVVEGVVDARVAHEGASVYVRMGAGDDAKVYEAFTLTVGEGEDASDFGYRIYVPTKALADWDGCASVFVGADDDTFGMRSFDQLA